VKDGIIGTITTLPEQLRRSLWEAEELEAVAVALNNRSRKTLGWKTPSEALNRGSEARRAARKAWSRAERCLPRAELPLEDAELVSKRQDLNVLLAVAHR
jgi:hypothetical protein